MGRLAIADVVDVPAARMRYELAPAALGGPAAPVATAGGHGCGGLSTGLVTAIDLETGTVLERLDVKDAVQDLAVDGDSLYVLTANRLGTVSLTGATLSVTGWVA